MVEVRHGDIKGKVPKTPNSGTTNIPILSLKVWEWYGKLMGREFNYWGSLEKSRNETIKEKTCQFRSRKCKKNRILINTLNGLPIHVFWQLTLNDLFANIA